MLRGWRGPWWAAGWCAWSRTGGGSSWRAAGSDDACTAGCWPGRLPGGGLGRRGRRRRRCDGWWPAGASAAGAGRRAAGAADTRHHPPHEGSHHHHDDDQEYPPGPVDARRQRSSRADDRTHAPTLTPRVRRSVGSSGRHARVPCPQASSWRGTPITRGTCRGVDPTRRRGTSWSARSCSSRPRSPACCRCTPRGWPDGRRRRPWPTSGPGRRFACGAGSVIHAERCACTRPRPSSTPSTTARCRETWSHSGHCPVSVTTRRPPCWPSPTGNASPSSTPTSGGCSADSWTVSPYRPPRSPDASASWPSRSCRTTRRRRRPGALPPWSSAPSCARRERRPAPGARCPTCAPGAPRASRSRPDRRRGPRPTRAPTGSVEAGSSRRCATPRAPLPGSAIEVTWDDALQRERALASLLDDGLVVRVGEGSLSLP